jgi:Lar family restriction alleviation protein
MQTSGRAENKNKRLKARGNPGGKEITMDEIKLKPCPFCGGEAMLTTNLYAGIVYIQCKCCTAMVGRKRKIVSSMIGKEYFVNKEEAIEAWNRRAEHE